MAKYLILVLLLVSCSKSEYPEKRGCFESGNEVSVKTLFNPKKVNSIIFDLPPKDWQRLRNEKPGNAGPNFSYTYFQAKMKINGKDFGEIGLRKKSFWGSQSSLKPAFKVKADKFTEKKRILTTIKKLTLNNSVQDPSYMRQCLSYQIYRYFGVVAPECSFTRVCVNNHDMGLYVHVSSIGKRFLKDNWPESKGKNPLYEGVITDFHPDKLKSLFSKNKSSRANRPVLEDIFSTSVENWSPEKFETHFDVDHVMTVLAMEFLMNHHDGPFTNGNNFFVYHFQKMNIIPWGTDRVFRSELMENRLSFFQKTTLGRFFKKHPEYQSRLNEKIEQMAPRVYILARNKVEILTKTIRDHVPVNETHTWEEERLRLIEIFDFLESFRVEQLQ